MLFNFKLILRDKHHPYEFLNFGYVCTTFPLGSCGYRLLPVDGEREGVLKGKERQRGRQKRENERKPMLAHSFKQKIQVFYKKKLGKKSLGQPPKKDQLGRSIENLYTVLK